MNEHVTPWLGAYHDGELRGRRLQQVESHLAQCATCRAELERIRAVAVLLQESPRARDLTPPERFVAQVGLRLPRRPKRSAWQRALETGWRLAPLGLLGTWAFVEAACVVSKILLAALRLGLGGDLVAGLLPAAQPQVGLAELLGAPSAGLSTIGRVLAWLWHSWHASAWSLTLHLAALAAISLLYWSWLASWWVRRRRQSHQD